MHLNESPRSGDRIAEIGQHPVDVPVIVVHADLAVRVTADALARSGLPAAEVTGIVLGWTVPQPEIFYGASTVAARIGASHATGAMLSQACATSAACLEAAALRVEAAWTSCPW